MNSVCAHREIKVGCCGFAFSQKEYFQRFSLIEIQQTFYQIPELRTAERWREEAPSDFEFTMKAWQLITHEPNSPTYRRLKEKIDRERHDRYGAFRPTPEVFQAWERTALFARTLGVSIVVFQCPTTFRPSEENLKNMDEFFSTIDRYGLTFVWEPRGNWPDSLILKLCEKYRLIHCVDPFKDDPLYGEFQYFRLHGLTGYGYRYTNEDLEWLKRWVEKRPTHILFNNKWMKEDSIRFLELVEKGG